MTDSGSTSCIHPIERPLGERLNYCIRDQHCWHPLHELLNDGEPLPIYPVDECCGCGRKREQVGARN